MGSIIPLWVLTLEHQTAVTHSKCSGSTAWLSLFVSIFLSLLKYLLQIFLTGEALFAVKVACCSILSSNKGQCFNLGLPTSLNLITFKNTIFSAFIIYNIFN
ncbi:hypothetical protein BpHYR1_034780 [Brachionus plicatilis]|uniref:Uncharacterized protein n=1 Tax=Brachionus plicatilis TaxID=10195 RepID=A0A3M7S205_BRAPC|nr:hypothetical protein BpHYR1_034780 [Brachionus plicatilis]